MGKKFKKVQKKRSKEKSLDFEDTKGTKGMIASRIARKRPETQKDISDENSSVLDKYIKQHREEIEADKYSVEEDIQHLDDFIKHVRSANELDSCDGGKKQKDNPNEHSKDASEHFEIVSEKKLEGYDSDLSKEDKKVGRGVYNKCKCIGLVVIACLLIVAAVVTHFYNKDGLNEKTVNSYRSSNSEKIKGEATGSSPAETALLKDFNDLYDSFFTDSSQTFIKNSSFSNLDSLKIILEKLLGTRSYSDVKDKYEDLGKKVKAIQEVNNQFSSPAIRDGILDTSVQVKPNASFASDVLTGNAKLDSVLTAAVKHGQSQLAAQEVHLERINSNQIEELFDQEFQSSIISTPEVYSRNISHLQRELSRVPYNQDAINDVTNSAWIFNPGVLENILDTSRQRHYFAGDEYILERVNIINGNGYYNLFRTDGTYLFSLNCKTGYFVGNGAGYADSLDF